MVSREAGGLRHHAVYSIGSNEVVYVDATGSTRLRGYAKLIGAGLDSADHTAVFAIGSDDALYVNRGVIGFAHLVGYAREIDARESDPGLTRDVVYTVGRDQGATSTARGSPPWSDTSESVEPAF